MKKGKDANEVLRKLRAYNQAQTEMGLEHTRYKGVFYSNESLLKRLRAAQQSGDRKMMLTFGYAGNKTITSEYPGNLEEFMEVISEVNKNIRLL